MASITSYVRGNEVVSTAEFRVPDEDGTLTNPTAVTFTVREKEADTPTAYVFGTAAQDTSPSPGIYKLTLVHDAEGIFHVHVAGTGTVKAAAEGTYEILHSRALA